MTDPVFVHADWAVWSKRPGTHDDYSVLASSTGVLNPGEFYQLLKHFTPGNPTAEQAAPGSLPWVMLSRFGVGDRLYLGISVQRPTDDRDGVGRPISRTSYFCVPYAELDRAPVSYQGLYEAVDKLADQDLVSQSSGSPIQLAIPRLDPAVLARAVRELDAMSVAATAARLLGGPVTITGPGFPDLSDRLRFIDAVAALLPYGYRPYLTAATWSDSAAGDRFRIVFANRARDEASRAPWRGAPPRPTADGPERAYLGYLERVIVHGNGDDNRAPDHNQPETHDQLETLIGYLADEGARKPRKFEEPDYAVAILHGFFLPSEVAARMDGGVPGDHIRQLLATGRIRELPEAKRVRALRQLISAADPEDFGLISRWFDEITAGDPRELLADVAVACHAQLWSGSTSLAHAYLQFASQRGLADDLLAQLVRPVPPGTDPALSLEAVGRLLADFVTGVPGGTASYPRTQRALADNPAAGAALLARMAISTQLGTHSLESAADWLTPAVDGVVGPFLALLGDASGLVPEPLDAGALDRLSRDGHKESVRYLLGTASQLRRLRLVLPGLATWLALTQPGRAQLGEVTDQYWRGVTMELTPADGDEAVWLDLVLLATGNEPRTLLAATYSQPQFSQRLATSWGELAEAVRNRGGDDRAADDLLESALIAALERVPWRADKASAAGVQYLAQSLSATRERPRLTTVVQNSRDALFQMPLDATPADIARACARAQRDGARPEQVAGALIASGSITSAAKALEVIEAMHGALAETRARNDSFVWPIEFATRFADGAFGPQIAADFPALAGKRYVEQIDFRIKLLDRIGRHAVPDAVPAVDAGRADYLDHNRHAIDDLIKEARKRQPRGGFLGLIAGKGSQGGEPGQGIESGPSGPGPGGQGGQR
jgi:hypothetical protein